MADSILSSTKKALGLAEDYTPFDPELIMHINSVLANLNQLGVGPSLGFAITGKDETWESVLGNENRLNNVKSYTFQKVKMLFDPPTVGYVVTAMKQQIEEAEWRITVQADDLNTGLPPQIVLDGGAP